MGIFTGVNRVTGTVEPLAEATGYKGEIGARMALIESVQNERALFNAIIESDFQEVNMLREGADIEALTESSLAGMGSKIKEFLKKVWEKIKALITSFITMITTVIIRDNKKLVDKYRTEVLKKDLSKMKYKWSECKKGKDEVFGPDFDKPTDVESVGDGLDELVSLTESDPAKIAAAATKARSKEYKEGFYKKFNLDMDDLLKSAKESLFNDPDDMEGMSSSLLRNIMSALEESKDVLKAWNKAKTDADKTYSKRLRQIDDALKTASNNTAPEVNIKKINYRHAMISTEQEIVTSLLSTIITIYKGRIKECRAAFSRAAAFNEKLVRESTELEDAMDDVQHGIIDDLFENEMFA